MAKQSTKNRILEHAGRLIRMNGFNNTGIQEILNSAGVPKGSFYFYFRSKDDLGLALIDYYAEYLGSVCASSLGANDGSPVERLRNFFGGMRMLFEQDEWKGGCPIGNLTQEMGSLSDAFRKRLQGVFRIMQTNIRDCLEEARSRGELNPALDVDEMAEFILNGWEGAVLRMKAEGNSDPLVLFEKIVFDSVLRR